MPFFICKIYKHVYARVVLTPMKRVGVHVQFFLHNKDVFAISRFNSYLQTLVFSDSSDKM